MIPSSLRAGKVFFDDLEACQQNQKIGNIGGAVRAAPPFVDSSPHQPFVGKKSVYLLSDNNS